VDEGSRLRIERRIVFWRSVCGCQTGALVALGALVWRISVVLHHPLTFSAVLTGLGWIFGAALVGKLGGLAVARTLLVLDLIRLRQRLDSGPETPLQP
jgi:hypothetical protein